RAFRYIASFRGGNTRAWLLSIVRNTCFEWLRRNRSSQDLLEFDENTVPFETGILNPEEACLQNDQLGLMKEALQMISPDFREVLVLRELEGLSYKEISEITGIPMGTVMSRLARARDGLRHFFSTLTRDPTSRNEMRQSL